jgi:formate-dependent nitrite reductase membrane component NrfD
MTTTEAGREPHAHGAFFGPAPRDHGSATAFGVNVRSYHGQPVIKEPVWTWQIPCYFYTGGLAGASAGLALLSGLRGNEVLARRAWASAALGVSASPALLIMDLGKPTRFLHMLRMFKVTSPMSVGSWNLTLSGTTTALAAANAWLGLFPKAGRAAKPLAALLGLPLSSYTAALIANTAVPVWHESRRELPFVFAAGAALSAGAAAVVSTPVADARPARRLALVGAAVEGPLVELMLHRLGEHKTAYKRGACARLAKVSRACVLTGTLLLSRRGGSSRAAATLGGLLMSAGAMARRWSVFKAGFQSAADPRYVVGPQRAGIESGQRPGAARTQARVAHGDPARGSPALTIRAAGQPSN